MILKGFPNKLLISINSYNGVCGGVDILALEIVVDQLRDHLHNTNGLEHTDSGHTQSDSDHTYTDSGYTHPYIDTYTKNPASGGHTNHSKRCSTRYEMSHWHATSSPKANIQSSKAILQSSFANIQSSSSVLRGVTNSYRRGSKTIRKLWKLFV